MKCPLPILLTWAALAGCGDPCDTPWYPDVDGDGWGATTSPVHACEAPEGAVRRAGDCDDDNRAIHPGRVERCDGVDEDCDGVVDADIPLWYADADGDGWGTTRLTTRVCDVPTGFVERGGDCDDDDDAAFPGAAERCNGQDDDCDALVDEGAPGDAIWYPDLDGDGFGADDQGQLLCDPPSTWTPIAGDCDDTRNDISPTRFELCNGVDDDCDGLVDADDPTLATGYLAWPDADGDGHGASDGEPTWGCSLVGASTDAIDCDDEDPDVHGAATEVCGGGDEDCDGLVDGDDPTLDPTSALQAWADLDGDGFGDPDAPMSACVLHAGIAANALDCDDTDRWIGPDVWLADADGDGAGAGPPTQGTTCTRPFGMVNVASLDCDDADRTRHPRATELCGDGIDQDCSGYDPPCRDAFDPLQDLDGVARAMFERSADQQTVSVGDLDGDGYTDLAVFGGSSDLTVLFGPAPESAGVFQDAVHVTLAGPAVSAVRIRGRSELALGIPTLDLVQVVSGPRHGMAVIGEISSSGTTPQAGRTLVSHDTGWLTVGYAGGLSSTTTASEAIDVGCIVDGQSADPSHAVATGGHLRWLSIGYVVSDPGFRGGSGGIWLMEQGCTIGTLQNRSVANVIGTPGAGLGEAMAFADLDGDGYDELLGTATDIGMGAGGVFAWSEPRYDLTLADAILGVMGNPNDAIGASVAGADVDGDGEMELLVGATTADLVGPDSGAVYVFEATAGVVSTADADWILLDVGGDAVGTSLEVVDLDGDGTEDLLVGGGSRDWWVPGL
ncbi:MAG: FG-GAP repeat protein [Alphaproteobacteria bacterium]|nr:FG-GAP repeat protein [Alphaproteobacteria bacterium]